MTFWRGFFLHKSIVAICYLLTVNSSAANSDVSTGTRDGFAWLEKIQHASHAYNYSGTFVYQQADLTRASRIAHLVDGKTRIEKLEVLDGRPREYIRNNKQIISYFPEQKLVLFENRIIKEVFPAILSANPEQLQQHYKVTTAKAQRIAGYASQLVILEPRDHYRHGYKFWADKNTGLLLRFHVINDKNEVVEQISFVDLHVGPVDPRQVQTSFADISGWRSDTTIITQRTHSPWLVQWVPPGFAKTHALRRLAPNTRLGSEAQSAGNTLPTRPVNQHEITQIVFSDGLATLSVFIDANIQGKTEGFAHQGAMNLVAKRQGDFWLMIMGEVPLAAIMRVANSIEYKPD